MGEGARKAGYHHGRWDQRVDPEQDRKTPGDQCLGHLVRSLCRRVPRLHRHQPDVSPPDFEFISISADEPAKRDKALQFLQRSQASATNYIFNVDDKYKLIEAIDPKWQG